MKFYDREHELKRLAKEAEKTKLRSSVVVLAGRRRIGKTRLVLEAYKESETPFLYFFVGKKSMTDLLTEWTEEIDSKIGKVHGEFASFSQLTAYLFDAAKAGQNEITVFFDEVQNFLTVNPSAFSDLQKHFDVNRETSSLMLIFAGSSYSLVEKIFTGAAEPLFGRAAEFMRLSYLPIETQKTILMDMGMYSGENLLHAFSIFDGIPRFYEEIFETGQKDFQEALRELMVEKDFLWEEGINMMREEFGKDYSIYHSILSAIARGKRSRNEIENAVMSSAGGYLQNLESLYRLIRKETPVFSKTSKGGILRYYLADNFYEFWFRFMSRHQSLREINRKDRAFEKIWALLPDYEGFKLEALIKRIFVEINPFGLEFNRLGRYWDRKGENEIDLVMVDDDSETAHVVEVKRSFAKFSKPREKIKFHAKAASIKDLERYTLRYYYAGIDDGDIVIMDDDDGRFVL
jgi:AAA+ ATPase superfamily predicted ATPase